MTITLLAVPASIREARRVARTFARNRGLAPDIVADVELAVSEACTNAVRYSGAPALELRLEHVDDELRVRVVDRGGGMRTSQRESGAGLGLPIIACVATRVEMSHPKGGGTDLSMAFAVAG